MTRRPITLHGRDHFPGHADPLTDLIQSTDMSVTIDTTAGFFDLSATSGGGGVTPAFAQVTNTVSGQSVANNTSAAINFSTGTTYDPSGILGTVGSSSVQLAATGIYAIFSTVKTLHVDATKTWTLSLTASSTVNLVVPTVFNSYPMLGHLPGATETLQVQTLTAPMNATNTFSVGVIHTFGSSINIVAVAWVALIG